MTGKEMREARKVLAITMEELADQTGYGMSSVWKMENERRKVSLRMEILLQTLLRRRAEEK